MAGMIPAWHPLVVHFPLALIVTATLCLSAAWMLQGRVVGQTLAVVGTWTLGFGAVGILFALGTGLAAVVDLQVGPAAHLAIAAHVRSAVLTTLLTLLAAVWRGAGVPESARPSAGFLIVLWLAAGSLVITGYRGGQNVYRFGIGVQESARPVSRLQLEPTAASTTWSVT